MFLRFLSSDEDRIDKSPNPFGCNFQCIQKRLGFLFQFHIFFAYCFIPLFPDGNRLFSGSQFLLQALVVSIGDNAVDRIAFERVAFIRCQRDIIIGLVGLLNFFNAMMTSILSRRREFAVLQAVGMTNRQLKTMLIYEGLFYAMSSVSAAFILSLAVGPLAGKMLGSMFWFFEYRFTILPVLLTIPVFLLLGWLIPCMMYDNAAKCSVVEQLRDAQ